MRCPFATPEFVRVLRVRVVAMPVRTVRHRAVVPKKQDALCTELEGQFDRSQAGIIFTVFFVVVQIVLCHCLARTAPALAGGRRLGAVGIPPREITCVKVIAPRG
ncbi:hypothetical protein D3C85_1588110 [compost metagenome]